MARFKPYNYDQHKLLPIDFRRQILPGSFEWAIDHVVDNKLDLSVFDARFNNDDTGAPAYDPAILLKIVLLAYGRGILSSRQMAAACRENIVFMALSADAQPHFTTLASFVSGLAEAIEPLFTDVLSYCDELGLIQGDMFAVDGCKLPSNASKHSSGKLSDFEARHDKLQKQVKKLLAAHERVDVGEEHGSDTTQREQARLKKLQREVDRIEAFLADAKPRRGAKGREVKSNLTDNDSAKMSTSHGVLQGYNGIAVVDQGSQLVMHADAIGQGPENDQLVPMLEGLELQLNRLGRDGLDQSKITADSGFHSSKALEQLEGMNVDAYVADRDMRNREEAFDSRDRHKARHRKERQREARKSTPSAPNIFSAADFEFDAENDTCQCPAGFRLYSNGRVTDKQGYQVRRFRGSQQSCGSCSLRSRCLTTPQSTQTKQIGFRLNKPIEQTALQRMKQKIDSEVGRAIYSRRLGTVEPVFGHHRMHGRDRFTVRGRTKVRAQWQLYSLVHNIGKLHTSGKMAA